MKSQKKAWPSPVTNPWPPPPTSVNTGYGGLKIVVNGLRQS